MKLETDIEGAGSLEELFELVKEVVFDFSGYERANVRLRVRNLGQSENEFLGAYYSYFSNKITLNSSPMLSLARYSKKLLNYYVFHILLHEYIHALGVVDETRTRMLTYAISTHYFGEDHIVTQMAENLGDYFPILSQSEEQTFQEEDSFEDHRQEYIDLINEILGEMFRL
jgi:hypothetical protein